MDDVRRVAVDLTTPAERTCIAIDGPAGSGKSTVAKAVARRLRLRYLDTGAMYRAVTWLALRGDVTGPDELARLAHGMVLRLATSPDDPTVTVDGTDVTTAIRDHEVSMAVSRVSAIAGVRRELVARQRAIAAGGGIVVEGRDIGTVVLPDAPVKIYLTASGEARVLRRAAERGAADAPAVELTRRELERRDRIDSTREVAPLAAAADAVEVDTTAMSVDEVVDAVVARVRATTACGSVR